MSKSLPLPPKTSMFWVDHAYSCEEATAAYEADGNLLSFAKVSENPSDDVAGSPPKHSMFWEGGTEKIEPPVQKEPEPRKFTKPKTSSEAAPAHFVPVRYALDQLESEDTQSFGLPEHWRGQGPARLNTLSYTLRQLRDGWLYVYDAKQKTLDEYEVKGAQFTYYKLSESEDPQSSQRGSPQKTSPFLSYSEGSVLSLCFSEHRWTWTMYLKVLDNASSHIGRMQTVVLMPNDHQRHISPIENLTEVADIEASAIEDGRFAQSCVVTMADDASSTIKPVAVESDITGALPEDEAAYFVAVTDHAADVRDMALHFASIASPYRLFTEQYASQWQLMQTAMQLCLFGASDKIDFPYRVRSKSQQLEFYQKMGEYYDNLGMLELTQQSQGPIVKGMPSTFSQGDIDYYQHQTTLVAESIQKEFGISASQFGRYEQWIATDRWRRQLNWQQMLSEMQALSEQKEAMLAQVVAAKQDFIAALEALSPHHLEQIFDLYSEETQWSLSQLHLEAVESFSLVIEEDDRGWAESQWSKPTSMLPLYTAGFSRSIYKKLEGALPSPLEVNSESQEGIMEHVSAWSNRTGMYAKIIDFMSNPNSSETMILKDLAQGFQELDKIFKAAASAAMRGVAEFSLSYSAQASSLLMATLSKPMQRHHFHWRAAFAEIVAHATAVTIPNDYAAKFADWRERMNQSHKELKLVNQELAAQRSNKVSSKQRQALLDKKRHLQKVVNANALGYPQRIVLEGNLVQRTLELQRKILSNQVKNLHTLFENVGGLSFLAFLFNAIALGDAIITIEETGLMSEDDFLDVQQKLFYVAAAWTGIRTGTLWNNVKAESQLRTHSMKSLQQLVDKKAEGFTGLAVDDLKRFNKWLAITASFGMLASGIEAYRSFQKIDQSHGVEKTIQRIHFSSLGAMTLVGLFQATGASTGALSANILFGGPVMAALLTLTLVYLWANSALGDLKQDRYQKWLDRLPWGYHPERARWSQAATLAEREQQDSQLVQEALFELRSIVQQPTVYHKPIEQVQAFPRYSHKTMVGIEVHIQLPNSVAKQGVKLRTNTQASAEELTAGRWYPNAELESLAASATPGKSVYSVTLPVRDNMQYLALQISYPSEEGERHYWLQHAIKQTASYSVISESSKQAAIIQTLSDTQGETVL
ncbi:T6SS effector BTH_I2691 family protein [Vibrio sp. Isolate24]|uniref:T6SS effector BTH_I2691 family protein n=1 Tax=Vibrio sp. Isolate24 TaxID=2908534 RepID=UPI001EFE642D|nr:T6SS effector BTH_I2691 family protein [Vibrio sp. Isolate24]MCG9680238.1 hypothetical protein [Vibrio sp. Isolate24]